MKWTPIARNTLLAKKIRKKVDEIAGVLKETNPQFQGVTGALEGKAGIVLFYFYYAVFSGDASFRDQACLLLEEIQTDIRERVSDHSLCRGLSGVGWVIRHLMGCGFLEADDGVLDSFDAYLSAAMHKELRQRHYDFLHGALGCALYLIHERPKELFKADMEQLVGVLSKISTPDKETNGIKWKARPSSAAPPEDLYNLGLAHGIPGIIVILGKLYRHGVSGASVLSLIEGAIKYITGKRLEKPSESIFPAYVREGKISRESALGWCHGDQGIGMALLHAARSIGNRDYENEALNIFRHAAARKNIGGSTVKSSTLCHGTAGVAHIFNRAHHYTGEKLFARAALYWLEETLARAGKEDEYAGYFALSKSSREDPLTPLGVSNLIGGLAGIGLSLMAAISHIEPRWDGLFLLS